MKVICTQENLKTALQTVSRIISGSNTLPILNNVLLRTEDGQLKLSTTNLELAITTSIRCKIDLEGSMSVPAKTLTDLVNNLPNTNIGIEDRGGDVFVSTDSYNTKLKTLPAEEFPLIPLVENGEKFSIGAADLKQAFDQVVFAASTSETQPEISGVLLQETGSGLKLVATDRYRLAEKTLTTSLQGQKSVIIPHKTAGEISRVLGSGTNPAEVTLADSQISVVMGDTFIISRLIDGQYPDYKQIVPIEFSTTITASKQALANALKTTGIFSRNTGSATVKYDTEKKIMVISASSHDVGESTISVEAEMSGESGAVILNHRYVLDVLNATTGDTIMIKIVNENAPVIFLPADDESYLYLVMPIKS